MSLQSQITQNREAIQEILNNAKTIDDLSLLPLLNKADKLLLSRDFNQEKHKVSISDILQLAQVSDIIGLQDALDLKYDKSGGTITGDVTVIGNLTVQGSTVAVDANINTTDAVLKMNDGEVGGGVTLGYAGFEIDRGTQNNFWFGYDEVRDRFTVGKITGLSAPQIATTQVLATRADSLTDQALVKWDGTANQFVDSGKLITDLDNVAYTNVNNNFTTGQTINGGIVSQGTNSGLWLYDRTTQEDSYRWISSAGTLSLIRRDALPVSTEITPWSINSLGNHNFGAGTADFGDYVVVNKSSYPKFILNETTNNISGRLEGDGGIMSMSLKTTSNHSLSFGTNNIERYSIDNGGNHDFKTGTATFGGLVTANAGVNITGNLDVSGIINFGSDSIYGKFNFGETLLNTPVSLFLTTLNAAGNSIRTEFIQNTNGRLDIILNAGGNGVGTLKIKDFDTTYLDINSDASVDFYGNINATGQTVTASQFIKSGATSDDILLGDGSHQVIERLFYQGSNPSDWATQNLVNGVHRMTSYTNNPFGSVHATVLTAGQDAGNSYGFQIASNTNSTNPLYVIRSVEEVGVYSAWQTLATQEWALATFSELTGDNVAYTNVNNNFSVSQTINGNLDVSGTGLFSGNLQIGETPFNPNISIANQDRYVEIVAGGTATGSSGLVFHNPGISTGVLEYVNADSVNGSFKFRGDDTYFGVEVDGYFDVSGIITGNGSGLTNVNANTINTAETTTNADFPVAFITQGANYANNVIYKDTSFGLAYNPTTGILTSLGYKVNGGTSDDILLGDGSTTSLAALSSGGATPAITSNGTTPSLNTGIDASEVRTLIGAGTMSSFALKVDGVSAGIVASLGMDFKGTTQIGISHNDNVGVDELTFSINDNSIGATQLNVVGNGTSGQVLSSDADGSFTWQTNSINNLTDVNLSNSSSTIKDNVLISQTGVQNGYWNQTSNLNILSLTADSISGPLVNFEIGTNAGTAYTATVADRGTVIRFTSSSAITISINTGSFTNVGDIAYYEQSGAGEITFSGTATLRYNANFQNKTDGQWSRVAVQKISSTEYRVFGELKPV